MNYFKSLIMASCVSLILAACNTDDLRTDLDNLTNRVESLESQFSLMNDNINAIRILVEGGKTIADVKEVDGVYTLTLSDGQTIRLNQGGEGKIVYPALGVNGNGEWTVDGVVLKQPNGDPVKAKGDKGEDGKTPEFQIEQTTNYWQVRYSTSEAWEYVTDDLGNKVVAVAGEGASAGDSFFHSIKVEGGFLTFTLKGDSEPRSEYKVSIVAKLSCSITNPITNYDETANLWSIAYGETAETIIQTEGDYVLVSAPKGWEAEIIEVDGIKKLSVTAPELGQVSTKSRAVADNQMDVIVQVNKGDNWAIAKIKVKAISDSYRALYESGQTLTINGVEIYKDLYGESTFINVSNAAAINKDGVYFVASDAEFELSGFVAKKVVIIGDNPTKMPKIKLTGGNKFAVSGTADTDEIFAMQNVELDLTTVTAATFQNAVNNSFENLLFENCIIRMSANQPFTYCSQSGGANGGFGTICFHNCIFDYSKNTTSKAIINVYNGSGSHYKIEFENNIFYNKEGNKSMRIVDVSNYTPNNIILCNNSFINVINNGYYCTANIFGSATVANNLFYDKSVATSFTFFNKPDVISANSANNFYYGKGWNWYASAWNNNDKSLIDKCNDDPFAGGTLDYDNLLFKPNEAFMTAHPNVGAQMK